MLRNLAPFLISQAITVFPVSAPVPKLKHMTGRLNQVFVFETGSCCVVQAGLELLGLSNFPASAFLVARTTDVQHGSAHYETFLPTPSSLFSPTLVA